MEYILTLLSRFLVKWFSPRPDIRKEGGLLVIQSGWRTALVSLGGRHRRVVVDPKAKLLRVSDRRFWLFSSTRRIEFDWIQEVFYTYQDLAGGLLSHYDQDLFTVGVRLRNGNVLTLFRFFGQGAFYNASVWPDWFYWEEHLIGRVAQSDFESESAQLADVLCHLTGAPLINEL